MGDGRHNVDISLGSASSSLIVESFSDSDDDDSENDDDDDSDSSYDDDTANNDDNEEMDSTNYKLQVALNNDSSLTKKDSGGGTELLQSETSTYPQVDIRTKRKVIVRLMSQLQTFLLLLLL